LQLTLAQTRSDTVHGARIEGVTPTADLETRLNPPQLAAVRHGDGDLLVTALDEPRPVAAAVVDEGIVQAPERRAGVQRHRAAGRGRLDPGGACAFRQLPGARAPLATPIVTVDLPNPFVGLTVGTQHDLLAGPDEELSAMATRAHAEAGVNADYYDIGGTGIKGAIVDTNTGQLKSDRYRELTPQPAKPNAVCDVVNDVATHFNWTGPVGCTFPAIVHHGVVFSAANVHKSWINTDCKGLLEKRLKGPVLVLNDADAAGIAEAKFGAGKDRDGLVIMLTLGTGIGSALLYHGELIPNAELGHMELRGTDAELRVSDRVRQERKLSWKKYAKRLNEYLSRLEFLFSPDLFIIGGGASKYHDKFLPRLKLRTPVVAAQLLNEAGIVGAALAVEKQMQQGTSVE